MITQINSSVSGGIKPAALDSGKAQQVDASGQSFKDILVDKIREVNNLILEKDAATAALAAGKTDSVSKMVIQIEKADEAFKTLMQIRDKLVDAWQEIERMQI